MKGKTLVGAGNSLGNQQPTAGGALTPAEAAQQCETAAKQSDNGNPIKIRYQSKNHTYHIIKLNQKLENICPVPHDRIFYFDKPSQVQIMVATSIISKGHINLKIKMDFTMPMYIVRLKKLQRHQQRLNKTLNKERISNVDRALKQSSILFKSKK